MTLPRKSSIHNAREHNLKNVDVRIPRDKFTVITGVSGSGKSTLAFDILFNEGQRRYLESLNAYARQFVQPGLTSGRGRHLWHSPTVAIEQRTSRGGRREHGGHPYRDLSLPAPAVCEAGNPVLSRLRCGHRAAKPRRHRRTTAARVPRSDHHPAGATGRGPQGFYTDLAKWAAKKGYRELRVDGVNVPTARWPRLNRFKEHTIELPVATLGVTAKTEFQLIRRWARRWTTARAW